MNTIVKKSLAILGFTALLAAAVACYFIRPWVPVQNIPPLDERAQTSMTFDPLFTETGQELEQHLLAWRHQYEVPSLSLAVGYRGQLLWAGAAGYANLDTREAVTLQTAYRIGSVSKTLLSTAIARATERGVVSLDKPIESYRRNYPHKGKGVTLRKLLSHQAGIRHYGVMWRPPFFEYFINDRFENVNQGLSLFIDDPLNYPPGEDFQYSSYGYNLASGVLESAAGSDFLTLMHETVFSPLAMANTAAEGTEHRLRTARWYDSQGAGKGVRSSAPTNASYKWAGGGFLSTPSDLVKLANAWLNETLFDRQTRSTFWTPQTLNNGEINSQHYALGWRVEHKPLDGFMDETSDLFIHHGGTASGSSAFLLIFPEHELVVAATTNLLEKEIEAAPAICFETAFQVSQWIRRTDHAL